MLTARQIADDALASIGFPLVDLPDELIYSNPVDFIEREMIIPELKMPMPLQDERGLVLREMSRRENDAFKYQTWLFSMPKKSAKTSIGAGVALWQAWRVENGEIYIMGNDLKQADNRMSQAIRYCVETNERMRRRVKISASKYTIKLDNGTRIESVPVDPRGEAGMNPTGLFSTETWGAKGQTAELFWSEATLSPTRLGDSFKFIESYAGIEGESLILERLYNGIVQPEYLHPTIPELYINGQSIAYWCTRRYLPWQQDEAYYRQQALEKTPEEFDRQHNNKWARSSEAFIPMEWWKAAKVETVPNPRSVVLGVDAAVHDDCFAIVIVSKEGQDIYVQEALVWKAKPGDVIPFEAIKTEIRRIFQQYTVAVVAYDEYQLADMAQQMGRNVFWEVFGQGKPRAVADKQLYDLIRDGRVKHSNTPVLDEHLLNANRKPEDENKLRIVKRNQQGKIDAVVALSMAVDRALFYNL